MFSTKRVISSTVGVLFLLAATYLGIHGTEAYADQSVFSPAQALTVNSLTDEVDANPGNGVCASASGFCTLRAAIQEANALAGDDTIILPSGVYTLTIGGRGEDAAAYGDLDITSNLTVTGVSTATTIIDANFLDRIFDITGAVTATISNVTLMNGEPGLAYVGNRNNGGGIRNMGTLTVNNCAFYNGRANNGGGIMNGIEGSSAGILTINNSVFANNNVYGSGSGGAIRNEYRMAVNNSTFVNNVVNDDGTFYPSGGAILNNFAGVATINNSTFLDNRGPFGGGLSTSGVLTITNSTFASNSASREHGGGILNWDNAGGYPAKLIIINSLLADNTANNGSGGGIVNGIEIVPGGTITVISSTLSNNSADNGGSLANYSGAIILNDVTVISNTAASNGGGISNNGVFTITHSTFNGNKAANGNGGGIHNSGTTSTLTLVNSTLSGNQASNGNGGGLANNDGIAALNNTTIASNTAASSGGGIYRNAGMLSLQNTILALNSSATGSPDCSGSITSGGYNLLGNNTSCTFGATTGDQIGTGASPINPLLGPLQNNGGATWTHALLSGSPALDAGNPAAPGSGGNACAATDQRGVTRPQGARCDVGAYEAPAVCTPQSRVSDIMLVVDRSGSMDNDNKLNDAKTAIAIFLDTTNVPPDQVGLVSFSDTATLDQSLTTDKAAVNAAVQALTTGGGTRMDLALLEARTELSSTRHITTHAKVIIMLSDGVQNPAPYDPVIDQADAAKAEGATIFTIGLGSNVDAALLQQVATSPSHYYFAPTGAELADIYQQISSAIACPDLGGTVYIDENDDGLYTPGTDSPAPNITVRMSGQAARQTTSQADGGYLFADNFAGTYTVTLDLTTIPSGYWPTAPITRVVSLTSTDILDNHFALASIKRAFLPAVARNFCAGPITDDFSSPISGWPVAETSNWSLAYLGGEYRMYAKTAEVVATVTRGERPTGQYIVEVEARKVSGANGNLGILFGLSDDWSELFTFEVNPATQTYEVWLYQSWVPKPWYRVATGSSSAIQSGFGVNRLRIAFSISGGYSANFYVNGTLLDSMWLPYASTAPRRVGLTATSASAGFDARFDNYKLVLEGCPENLQVATMGMSQALDAIFESSRPDERIQR